MGLVARTISNRPNTDFDIVARQGITQAGDEQVVIALAADGLPVALTGANARKTVGASVVTLTLPGTGEEWAEIEIPSDAAGDILYWDDGKDPTAVPGRVLPVGTVRRLGNATALANFKCCRRTVDTTILVSLYKNP